MTNLRKKNFNFRSKISDLEEQARGKNENKSNAGAVGAGAIRRAEEPANPTEAMGNGGNGFNEMQLAMHIQR